MKIWTGYGSEHSYSLVMIGHFTDEASARNAEAQFRRLGIAAESELPASGWESPDARFSDSMWDLLKELGIYDLSRSDIENFGYEHGVEVTGNELRVSTDEGEVQGFLKVLINGGAKVEIYSSHNWTVEGEPRGEEAEGETPGATKD
jgi:hypothetical protein